jgi:hypothetical protein
MVTIVLSYIVSMLTPVRAIFLEISMPKALTPIKNMLDLAY